MPDRTAIAAGELLARWLDGVRGDRIVTADGTRHLITSVAIRTHEGLVRVGWTRPDGQPDGLAAAPATELTAELVDADDLSGGGHFEVYRDGFVHVLAARCPTCIFRPGNRMSLNPGRVRGMVAVAVARQGMIPCHEVMDTPEPAICRGFYDTNANNIQALQVAGRLDRIRFQPPLQEDPDGP
jgi:hypothetical protein